MDLKFEAPEKKRPVHDLQHAVKIKELEDKINVLHSLLIESVAELEKLHEELRVTNVSRFPLKHIVKERWRKSILVIKERLKLVA